VQDEFMPEQCALHLASPVLAPIDPGHEHWSPLLDVHCAREVRLAEAWRHRSATRFNKARPLLSCSWRSTPTLRRTITCMCWSFRASVSST